jgi:hypothetical protein
MSLFRLTDTTLLALFVSLCDGHVMLLARADVDLSRTVDATVGLVHDFLVYKMHN